MSALASVPQRPLSLASAMRSLPLVVAPSPQQPRRLLILRVSKTVPVDRSGQPSALQVTDRVASAKKDIALVTNLLAQISNRARR